MTTLPNGKSRSKAVRPLDQLRRHVESIEAASSARRGQRLSALTEFLENLTDADRESICRLWPRLPLVEQERLAGPLSELGGSFGPGGDLLRGIKAAHEKWAESLPEPPSLFPPQRSADEWTAIFVREGWPEAKAREVAVELARHPDEAMVDFWMEQGHSRESAEAHVAEHRRDRRLDAATQVVAEAAFDAGTRHRAGELATACPEVARRAADLARDMTRSSATRESAAKLLDGPLAALFRAIDRTVRAGQPDARSVAMGDGKGVILAQRAEDAPFWAWYDTAMEAGELLDASANGTPPDEKATAAMAQRVVAIAEEAAALTVRFRRERGRPPKAALDAAEKLKAQGHSWANIAILLDARGLRLNPHTPDNIRKSVLARRRQTPAKK